MTSKPAAFAGIPLSVILRLLLLISIVCAGIAIVYYSPVSQWLDQERIQAATMQVRSLWWAPVLLIAAYLAFGATGVPAAPLFVAGAVFGPLYGTLYNVAGLLLSAIGGFLLARTLGRDFVLHMAKGRFYRVKRFFTRFGFWPLVQARFLPIPDTVLNFSAAMAGVPLRIFVLASLVGIFPSTLIHTLCISELIFADSASARALTGIFYLGSFVVINVLIGGPWLMSQWRRRQRYHRIMAERQENQK